MSQTVISKEEHKALKSQMGISKIDITKVGCPKLRFPIEKKTGKELLVAEKKVVEKAKRNPIGFKNKK